MTREEAGKFYEKIIQEKADYNMIQLQMKNKYVIL